MISYQNILFLKEFLNLVYCSGLFEIKGRYGTSFWSTFFALFFKEKCVMYYSISWPSLNIRT